MNCSKHSLHWMSFHFSLYQKNKYFSIAFLLKWVMEYLIQIQSSIITFQYHFPYITEVATSFEKSQRRKIWSSVSLSFILFIINTFDSIVLVSPWRAPSLRVMDWSWFRSHSSFIQSFILSNTILWHFMNAWRSNWIDMREGRFFNSNDSYQ